MYSLFIFLREETIDMKPFRKKGKEENIEEVMGHFPTSKKGCEIAGGEYNEKTKECEQRQFRDKSNPKEMTIKKFDKVERADDIVTVKTADDEE